MPFLRGSPRRRGELTLTPFLEVRRLWHRYASSDWTLQDIDFSLEAGQLLGLLGPSGCGKTTLLRLIAGFERPSQGVIALAGRELSSPSRWLAPERRQVGMLFQDYALFPHLDAWQNACFGLSAGADRNRVHWLLELLGLQGLDKRFPHELSGGQRQRLALVRALAPQPQVLLLDEPFSNLDVDVRLRLRAELPRVLKECGVTALMVTHDPEEALAICDQVAVLSGGYWHQCAPPQQLVAQPATAFVATFVLQANVLSRDVLGGLTSVVQQRACDQLQAGATSSWLVRQEDLQLSADASGPAQVLSREFLGYEWLYVIDVDGQRLRLRVGLEQDLSPGSRCRLNLREGWQPQLIPDSVLGSGAVSPPVPAA